MKKNLLPKDQRDVRCFRAAFTLIELLTVIAIIGILAAILIPVVGRVRESARQAKCISNLRQIGVGIQMYVDDHYQTLPGPYWSVGGIHSFEKGSNPRLCLQLAPYLDVAEPPQGETRIVDLLVCPSYEGKASHSVEGGVSYRVNTAGTARHAVFSYSDPTKEVPGKKVTLFDNPTRTYTLADDFNPAGGRWATEPLHPGVRNVLFLSGHVEKLSLNQYPDHDSLQAMQD